MPVNKTTEIIISMAIIPSNPVTIKVNIVTHLQYTMMNLITPVFLNKIQLAESKKT